jgi:hypothetical protein
VAQVVRGRLAVGQRRASGGGLLGTGAGPGREAVGRAGVRVGEAQVAAQGTDRTHPQVRHPRDHRTHLPVNVSFKQTFWAIFGGNVVSTTLFAGARRLDRFGFIFVVGTILACLSSAHFYSSFENFIGILLFFFVPWSAINLVDYYLVKHGRYDVQSFFKPDGIYGRFQWWACLCYVITLAVQVPFLDQLFYVGPLVSSLGGADISWIVGFGVASLLYLAGARRFVRVQLGRRPRWVWRLKVHAVEG